MYRVSYCIYKGSSSGRVREKGGGKGEGGRERRQNKLVHRQLPVASGLGSRNAKSAATNVCNARGAFHETSCL